MINLCGKLPNISIVLQPLLSLDSVNQMVPALTVKIMPSANICQMSSNLNDHPTVYVTIMMEYNIELQVPLQLILPLGHPANFRLK